MNSLYLENSIMGSLFRFFSQYFSTATRPTQCLLTYSPAGLTVLSFPSFPSPEFLVLGDTSLLEQLLPGPSERNGDEPFSSPANCGIGLQPDSSGLTE